MIAIPKSDKILIAIDGNSSSGKGTIAKKVASYFNLPYLNTGGLYRGIAFLALKNHLNFKIDLDKIILLCKELTNIDLEGAELHNEEIAQSASMIASSSDIRNAILSLQRNFADDGLRYNNGAVLEGRDIGTVICPDANYKFFITASSEVRAERRFRQLEKRGLSVEYDLILRQIKDRDEQDINRTHSPLKKADDAIEIETSNITVEQVFEKILSHILKNKHKN
jgi:cytidylate kinase